MSAQSKSDRKNTFQFCLDKNIAGVGDCGYCSGLTPGVCNCDLMAQPPKAVVKTVRRARRKAKVAGG